jgi:hypothetical protein
VLREPLAGLDASAHQALAFRILQPHDAAENSGTSIDLTLRLEDTAGQVAAVPLSDAPQGALRTSAQVGAGTPAKSVYESYRLPLAAFTEANAALSLASLQAVEWVFDRTPSGAIVLDDVVFARAGDCE